MSNTGNYLADAEPPDYDDRDVCLDCGLPENECECDEKREKRYGE